MCLPSENIVNNNNNNNDNNNNNSVFFLEMHVLLYCKFVNFREGFIFAKLS